MTEIVKLETRGQVAHIVLNRPDKLNAISVDTLAALGECVRTVRADPEIRAVVIRGEGRVFCAGGDLASDGAIFGTDPKVAAFVELWHNTFNEIETLPKPVISAVHGLALAGGLELVTVCDFTIVAEGTRMGDQHARFGIFPGGGASQRLPRLIGERRAKWLLMSGDWMTAEEALEYGLVKEIVAPDRLVDRAQELAEILASRSPLLNATVKETVRLGLRTDLATALAMERTRHLLHMSSEDARIGVQAFLDRTEPRFVGR